jgi:multimeric flavodoxin WrbA
MKVIAINGSPRKDGNCGRSLARLGEGLVKEGIGFEVLHVGAEAIRGCTACGSCGKRRDGTCVFADDAVNGGIQKMRAADGIVLASPVYYSGVAGTMKSFLDRACYVAGASGGFFRHKVGAALVSVRRSGGSAALDCLNHYLSYSEMIVATSNYWNIVHGAKPGEAEQDAEGLQIVDVLATNLAWILKMREATRDSLPEPPRSDKVYTNFVR